MDSQNVHQLVAPFIDGDLMGSYSDATVDVVNPSNGQHCLVIPAGCDSDVDRAVTSARAAFEDGRWSEAAPSVRKAVLHRYADSITAQSALLDALDAEEMGKPISEPLFNAGSAAALVRFYAEAVDKAVGDLYTSDKYSMVAQRRVPRGVVAAVVPWNFPTFNAVLKLAPALAVGNSVVLKPSELSTRSAIVLARLALEAGLPTGVFNVVPGLGSTVGRALGLHPDVDMLTFTGSTEIGKLMMQYAGQSNLKVVMAECGGKSPHIVFDDGVDLDATSESIARSLLTNQGQICSVGSRLLVQKSIETRVLERIAARLEKRVMGAALDPTTTFGPLASAKHHARVMQYIESAPRDGATLVAGGRRGLPQSGGYFVEPALFANVQPSARIAQEEIFGPVLSTISFNDEAEALRIANGTMFGLSAYVWTASLSRGMSVARRIRSSVRINAGAPIGEGAGYAISWEPFGQSGLGIEGGIAGMESYTRRQRVWVNHG